MLKLNDSHVTDRRLALMSGKSKRKFSFAGWQRAMVEYANAGNACFREHDIRA